MSDTRRGRSIAAWVAAAGGVLAVAGSILTWATVTGRRGAVVEANGSDLFGAITVGCGLVAVVAGLWSLSVARGRAVLAAAVLAAGLASLGVSVYVATSEGSVISALSEDEALRRRIGSGRGRRAPQVDPAAGLFVVMGGAALAAAGGAAGLFTARERAATASAAANVLDESRSGGENTPTSG